MYETFSLFQRIFNSFEMLDLTSGKSTLACALSRGLLAMGKHSYILDGDNVRHGLNQDLSFKAEDRVENIRRIGWFTSCFWIYFFYTISCIKLILSHFPFIGEVAKLFADAGVICIASLISPYRKDRDACRALLPGGDFIEVSLYDSEDLLYKELGLQIFQNIVMTLILTVLKSLRLMVLVIIRCSWTSLWKCVRRGTLRACTSLQELEKLKVFSRCLMYCCIEDCILIFSSLYVSVSLLFFPRIVSSSFFLVLQYCPHVDDSEWCVLSSYCLKNTYLMWCLWIHRLKLLCSLTH